MNRASFYDSVRSRTSGVFGTSLSQKQVEGCEAILNEAERRGTPLTHVAYILATAYHECAYTMQPVRETLAKSDDGAIAALEKAWKAGKLPWVSKPYWRKDKDGKSWFGRGLVQITHRDNDEKFGIADNPSKALEMPAAVRIIFDGMEKGLFTGKKLSDYSVILTSNPPQTSYDYYNARAIVNGDKKKNGAKIATEAKAFEKALCAAGYRVSLSAGGGLSGGGSLSPTLPKPDTPILTPPSRTPSSGAVNLLALIAAACAAAGAYFLDLFKGWF